MATAANNRVLTNNVGLAYSIETQLGVPGPDWVKLEPNGISTFGATITTVARDPISQNRQRRKGTVTDLDSAVEMDADLTLSSFRDFAEAFAFAVGINADVTQLKLTAAVTAGGGLTLDTALNAAQAEKFEIGTLVWVDGFSTNGNNGLKEVDVDAVDTDTSISVVDVLVDETSDARVSFAGTRVPDAASPTWTWDGPNKRATLNSTGLGTLMAQLGATPGMLVHIGSVAQVGGAIQNAFDNVGTDDGFGFARIVSVDTDDVVFDKVDAALQFTMPDPGVVDVVFAEFIRNVPVSDPDFLERCFSFEASYPGLGDGTVGNTDDAFQYARGNFCNTMATELPLTDKATVTFAFVGTDTENPTTTQDPNAVTADDPTQTSAFNTSSDIARLRITEADEDGLTTDFKSLTLTLNNNVSPEKVLGTLGAAFINTGNFEVDIEAQLLFTNPLVINKIRANETVTMDLVLKNDDGVIALDIPAMTLGGGDREFPVNESVLINTTSQAFLDPALGTSIGISIMPVPLP